MHAHFLDPYRPRSSPVHQLDPRVKLILTLAFILTTALTPAGAWPVYILLYSLLLAVEVLSELGVGFVLKRSVLALPFALAALPILFTLQGQPLGSIPFGPFTLTVTQEGVVRFLSISIKSWLSVQAAVIVSTSTRFPDLLQAMRAIGIPRQIVAIFSLMWRYLFVLVDEVLRLQRGRAARSGEAALPGSKPGGSLTWRAHVTGGMAGNLFLRAFERSDRIYFAMLSRGYDGEIRAFPYPPLTGLERLILIAFLLLLLLLLILSILF